MERIQIATVLRDRDARPAGAAENVRERARRQVDHVRSTLERMIDQGRIRPGDRLATERALADQFGASRNVVRTALAGLHRAGKIARRVGHGTVVQAPPTAPPRVDALSLRDTSPAELMEFRLAFEPGLVESIVLNASEADIGAVFACLDRGDAAARLDEWEEWDRAFHRSLVAASHNRLSMAVYEAVIGIRHQRPWLQIKAGHTDPRNWKRYQVEHRSVAEALGRRDAAAAAATLRAHLAGVRAKMLGVVPASAEEGRHAVEHR